jgi:hypothetical protein
MNEAEKAKIFANLFGGELTTKFNTECLMIDEAICWIAFGSYGFPHQGPKIIAEFFISGDLEDYFDRESDEQSLRFDIARRQLFSAAANGKVSALGILDPVEVDEDASEESKIASRVISVDRIEPDFFLDGNWKEGEDGYAFGSKVYSGVFVDRIGFEELFAALRMPAAPRPLPEAGASELAYDAKRKKRGRRATWDWELILAGTLYGIGKAGDVFTAQADLERRIAEFCQDEYADEPSQSMIRAKSPPLFDFLRRQSR